MMPNDNSTTYTKMQHIDIALQQNLFRKFLVSVVQLKSDTAILYSNTLGQIRPEFILKYSVCTSVYELMDSIVLRRVVDDLPDGSFAKRADRAVKHYIDFLQVQRERELVESREKLYYEHLRLVYSDSAAQRYCRLLRSNLIVDTMLKSFGVSSVYCLNNERDLNLVKVLFANSGINSHNAFRAAVDKYIEWINLIGGIEGGDKTPEPSADDIQRVLDEKNRIIADLEKHLAEKDTEIAQLRNLQPQNVVSHESDVADIFSEIANRYLLCMKNKAVQRRKEVKDSLHSIMEELKMHKFVPEDLQKCINSFDDVAAPDIPQINIKEYILEKNVSHQVDNVEAGGTGIIVDGGMKL